MACNRCVLVEGKSGAGERTWYKGSRLISVHKTKQKTKYTKNNKSGYKTRRTPTRLAQNIQSNNLRQGHERKQRVKYTTCN